MAKKTPYLLLQMAIQPARGAPTHIKGWMDEPEMVQVAFSLDFVDTLRPKLVAENSVVIDIMNDFKVLKNQSGQPDPEIAHWIADKYKREIEEVIGIWLTRHPELVPSKE